MAKLKVGDVVEVSGWVMLKNIDPGRYRVKKITAHYGHDVYDFAKPKGSKTVARHLAENVDPWIRDPGDPDNNKIVVV